jgi:hypothetical protein
MIICYSFIYNVGNRKVYLVEQRQYILEKYNVTKDELAKYYKDYLRLSIYKSLMRRYLDEQKFEKTLIDSILLQGKTESINTNEKKKTKKGFEGTDEQHKLYKKMDGKSRRTISAFEKIMFPGVKMDPRGGDRYKKKQAKPESSSSSSSSSSLPLSSSSSSALITYLVTPYRSNLA